MTELDRRAVLAGCVGCVALVAGCGSSDASGGHPDGAASSAAPSPAAPSSAAPSPAAPSSAAASSAASSPAPAGKPLARLSDLPVGRTVSATGKKGPLILHRTSATVVRAFSAVCPHQGCTVAPKGSKLVCPCHGSQFADASGKLLHGPATKGLSAVSVEVRDGGIYES